MCNLNGEERTLNEIQNLYKMRVSKTAQQVKVLAKNLIT